MKQPYSQYSPFGLDGYSLALSANGKLSGTVEYYWNTTKICLNNNSARSSDIIVITEI